LLDTARNIAGIAAAVLALVFGVLSAREWSRERRLADRIDRTLSIAARLGDGSSKFLLTALAEQDAAELVVLRMGFDPRGGENLETLMNSPAFTDEQRRAMIADILPHVEAGKEASRLNRARQWGYNAGFTTAAAVLVAMLVLSVFTHSYWFLMLVGSLIAASGVSRILRSRLLRSRRGSAPRAEGGTARDATW
jgi:hypothetical protein